MKNITIFGNKDVRKIQSIYQKYGFGYDSYYDRQLLNELEEYNKSLSYTYLASGQNGYFSEQIDKNGFSGLKVAESDVEDARFIAKCFGKDIHHQKNQIPIVYTTLLGSVEFNYGTQTFPAGIFEDVFMGYATHALQINPILGESEQDFYLRVLKYQIDNNSNFDKKYEQEVLFRGKRLIENFCRHKNRIYLIKLEDVLSYKASWGDVEGLRNANNSKEEANKIIEELPTLKELMDIYHVDIRMLYNNPNMTSEFGITLYGNISKDKIKYIEIERIYNMIQKRAYDMGMQIGEEITRVYEKSCSL